MLVDHWARKARIVEWDIRPFIDGELRESAAREFFDVVNPATGERLYQAPVGDAADVDAAVAAARRAFAGEWPRLGVQTRRRVLAAFIEEIAAAAHDIAILDSLEMGKPVAQALFDAEILAPAFGRFCVEAVDKLRGSVANTEPGMLAMSLWEPRGVVGAIVPWNFPVINAIVKMAPALAAGNCVVLKPSELANGSAFLLARLATEAGIPPGVINVVPGLGPTVGAAIARHPGINFLSFTGSTATGRKLLAQCGESNGKPALLECGGKSPQIVFDDMGDVAKLAARIAGEALWNQGQVCVSRARVLVHRSIHAALVEALAAHVAGVAPGDPLDPATSHGPLASRGQWQRVAGMVRRAVYDGALQVGGILPEDDGGCFMKPVLFDGVTPDMNIWREEVFGPVIGVTAFSTLDEALSLANDCDYGLAATVWTRDLATGIAMARGIEAGEVVVHSGFSEHEGPGFSLPQEGRKGSGFGIETGVEGIKSYMTVKKIELHGISA